MTTTTTRPALVPIDQVVTMLAARAADLAMELLPGGRREGREWRCGSLAGEPGGSMAVHLAGGKAGVWSDFASNERGDALDLVAHVLFRGDKRQALAWSKRWLRIERGDPRALDVQRRAVEARAEQNEEEAEKSRAHAFKLWLNAQPTIRNTPVEHYLAGRGIDLAQLGRQPRAIRFHPALFNWERGEKLPAMVTMIGDGVTGQLVAVHRTWLEQAGPNDWRKARLDKPKMVLGRMRGGYIRLWRGASGKPMAEAPIGETVDVVEGIESGLSVAMATPEARIVAAVSLSNMANLVFPANVTRVCLWREADTHPKAIEGFDRAVAALLGRGLEVVVPEMPPGFGDANDLLRGNAG